MWRAPRGATARVTGIARVGRRTKDLARTIRPGEIASIDHRDIDRVAAESLMAAGVAAVVNANESVSGRFRTAVRNAWSPRRSHC